VCCPVLQGITLRVVVTWNFRIGSLPITGAPPALAGARETTPPPPRAGRCSGDPCVRGRAAAAPAPPPAVPDQHVGGGRICHQPRDKRARIIRQVAHDDPGEERVGADGVILNRASGRRIDDLDLHRHGRSETEVTPGCKPGLEQPNPAQHAPMLKRSRSGNFIPKSVEAAAMPRLVSWQVAEHNAYTENQRPTTRPASIPSVETAAVITMPQMISAAANAAVQLFNVP
jgi:hypothetical protein